MKITLTKRADAVNVKFKAADDDEAADLRTVLARSLADGAALETLVVAAEELKVLGYTGEVTKQTKATREFTLSKAVKVA